MAFCTNCGAQLPDNAPGCPYCSAAVAQQKNTYYQPPSNQPVGANIPPVENYQPYYQSPQNNTYENQVTTARVLGILSIVLGILISPLLGWILGGIGISRSNGAFQFAVYTGNAYLQSEAASAKKLCKTGIIISSVIVAFAVFFGIVIGLLGSSAIFSEL